MSLPYVIPAGTDIRALMPDPRFPWDNLGRVQLHVCRGWGPGRIFWGHYFSRELLEDSGFPIDEYIAAEMVRHCLRLQDEEPGVATAPVTADGSYQVEWEWRPPNAQPRWGITGRLIDGSVIDRLISEVRRLRGQANYERSQIIPRLIQNIEKPTTADPNGGFIVPAEMQRELVAHWRKPLRTAAESTPLLAYLTEQIAKDIAETETDLFLYGAHYRDKNGRRIDPRTVKIKP